ncbi:MAG: hypothetical protein U1E94_06340 [Agitococcus sp.]
MAFSLYGFQPPEMAVTQYATKDAIGDMGGMPVRIPYYFANYLEYEGDPTWGEKRSEPKPTRNYQSKITSFGFDVRYPDMAGLINDEMYKNRRSYTIYNTPWISVGINAWSTFDGGHQGLENRAKALEHYNPELPWSNYKRVPQNEFGLEAYRIHIEKGQEERYVFDRKDGKDPVVSIKKYDNDSPDIYVYRHPTTHKVETYISCNHTKIGQALCQQWFDLSDDLQVRIDVMYRREELAKWQDIQTAVKKLVLSFKAPIKEKR